MITLQSTSRGPPFAGDLPLTWKLRRRGAQGFSPNSRVLLSQPICEAWGVGCRTCMLLTQGSVLRRDFCLEW
jgi:hypothetical protein